MTPSTTGGGPISNQVVNLYFSGGAYLSVRTKMARSGSTGQNFGDICSGVQQPNPGRREDVSHGSNLDLRLGNAPQIDETTLSDAKPRSNREYGLAHVLNIRG
jgi:hypothetical protein